MSNVFFAYPAAPQQLGETIGRAADRVSATSGLACTTWPQLDIAGHFLVEDVLDAIDASTFVVADVTRLNFNVMFEIGYAIGKSKRVVLVVNDALQPATREISQLGILDTLGYKCYQNSDGLAAIIGKVSDTEPLRVQDRTPDRATPLYVIDTLYKSDASVRILSKIKKSRIRFRVYDPKEQSRLSALDALRNVTQSIGVIAHLLPSNATDYERNNLRVAFVAGLAHGLEKETLIFQAGDEPVPIDYRDLVSIYHRASDIDDYINELAPLIVESLQVALGEQPQVDRGFLERIDLGAPAAENEAETLGSYYVATDEFNKALSGNIRIAVGRKGSGKTALFFRLRDRVRRDRTKIVIDLKPDGHQLKRFKHVVLEWLAEAVQEHVATAFWEYVLLLELAYKLLEKDEARHTRDHTLYRDYRRLVDLYGTGTGTGKVDFSERMLSLIQRVGDAFTERYGEGKTRYLTASEVTSLVYTHDIPALRSHLADYLQHKQEVWILFDNIDKGWPTRGVESIDIVILRGLLDATRRIQQYFQARKVDVRSVVFVRNDVYELLVNESPDRGKESKVSLDWTDPELFREFLRRRIVANGLPEKSNFSEVWSRIAVSHVYGEDSAQFLIDRCLMRPRNLLTLVNYGKGNAVNARRHQISERDIITAYHTYSADIGNEIGLEVRDVFPQGEDILYAFIGSPPWLTLGDVQKVLARTAVPEHDWVRLIEILAWFAFLGVVRQTDGELAETFIYDVFYDMKKMRKLALDFRDVSTPLCIHRAFWPFLDINDKE